MSRTATAPVSGARSSQAARPVRVLHLLHTVAHGGVETAILNWTKAHDPARFDVRLAAFRNPGGTEEAFLRSARADGFDVAMFPWNRWKPVLRAGWLVARYCREQGIDILHCHNTYANLTGLVAARLAPVKTITTMYVWGDLGWKRNALQKIDAAILPFFDQVSAHCEDAFQGTVERGIPADQLRLLICGYPVRRADLPDHERREFRSSLGASDGVPVLLYLARFWPEKAHDNLLDAMEILLRERPDVQLWLPGNGPDLERIQDMVESRRLGGNVRFLGFRSDFERLLSACDIQVHPSDAEGVALAICAGMAAGKPIVASRVGGLNEVLKDGVSAVLLPPRQPRLLAEAILDLIRNPEKAAALGAAARRFIETEYSIEVAAARVEETYSALVSK